MGYLQFITICKSVGWSRQESNLDLEFRKLLFYPLNYETMILLSQLAG